MKKIFNTGYTALLLIAMLCIAKCANGQKPTPKPDTLIAEWNTFAPFNILSNDKDPNGDKIVVTSYKIGKTTYKPNDTVMLKGKGQIIITTAGLVSFTPLYNFYGIINISYVCNDGTSGTGKSSKVFIKLHTADYIYDCTRAWTTNGSERGYYTFSGDKYMIVFPSGTRYITKQEYDLAIKSIPRK